MTQYLIMCRSLTNAQKTARALERSGFTAPIVKAPQILTTGGCGYAVSIRTKLDEARQILKKLDIPFGKIYMRSDDGEYSEVRR